MLYYSKRMIFQRYIHCIWEWSYMNIHQVKITDILRTIKTVWDFQIFHWIFISWNISKRYQQMYQIIILTCKKQLNRHGWMYPVISLTWWWLVPGVQRSPPLSLLVHLCLLSHPQRPSMSCHSHLLSQSS